MTSYLTTSPTGISAKGKGPIVPDHVESIRESEVVRAAPPGATQVAVAATAATSSSITTENPVVICVVHVPSPLGPCELMRNGTT